MDEYTYDIFYDVKHLSLEEKEQLCRDGLKKSYDWWVDHLITIQRQRIEMDFETIVKKLYDDEFLHFVFIHRKGYENWKDDEHRWCLEIGFVSGIYYLWIYIEEKEIPYFVKKYKLTEKL